MDRKSIIIIAVFIVFLAVKQAAFCQLPAEIDTTAAWSMSWNDEFDYPDTQLEDQWVSQNGPSGHILCSRWRENAIVKDHILELVAKKESRGGQDWTAGNIWTKEKFGYGYFECRYKYAGATGTNNSFWMWPRSVPEGEKAFELDVNEGHYPNIVNTNIHNWTDKDPDGSHAVWPKRYALGGIEPQPAYTHILETPVSTNKIRFTSTHNPHFHIGEFRIYAPNAIGYPKNAVSNTADSEVAGLVNYTRDAATKITASGQYDVAGRNTDPANVANGLNTGTNPSWIAQAEGDKWLEITLAEAKEIGCIQFTNGWYGGGEWKAMINNYKIEYYDGEKWIEIATFDLTNGTDFSEEYHTYGFLWNDNEFKWYFDGELLRSMNHTECHSPTHMYLSLAILDKGYAGAVTDAIDGTSMKVDYVRYYKKSDNTSSPKIKGVQSSTYPNPVNDRLYFKNISGLNRLKIYNTQGILQIEAEIPVTESISVSNLSAGVYCFVVNGSSGASTGKFIKK